MNISTTWAEQDYPMSEEDFDWGDDSSTFGDRLALAREHAGMDQAQLARRLGVRIAAIQNWEDDRSEPRSNRLQMLSGLLGVSIIWLMTGEGDGGPSGPSAADLPSDLNAVLDELAEIRMTQMKLSERSRIVEKRLRALMTQG